MNSNLIFLIILDGVVYSVSQSRQSVDEAVSETFLVSVLLAPVSLTRNDVSTSTEYTEYSDFIAVAIGL